MRPNLRLTTRLIAGLFLSQGAAAIGSAAEQPAPPPALATPVPAAPAPVEVVAAPAADCAACAPAPSPWAKWPVYTPMPRPGLFFTPPDGPGYYSLCDVFAHNCREKRPKQPYGAASIIPFSFFDADYRYLDDPNNTQVDWFDQFKRLHPNDCWMLSLGGEFRYRFMDETNSRLRGVNNTYSLLRERAYADISYQDRFRVYVEFLAAQDFGFSLPPLAIDRNSADFLNLFLDVKVLETGGSPLVVRVGRQELLYGSQRLISPLDWANTRRTFQGAKAFWHSADWDLDAFWVKPVIVNAINLDNWDQNQNFSGAWATYKPKKGTAVDFYILNLNNGAPVAVGRNGIRGGFDITTFGSRASGDFDGRFLYDVEGMVQTGIRANQEVVAGSYTVGAGYQAKNLAWTPTFWAYNDWASGNQNPGGPGNNSTFNQLFPFGHYYGGFIDYVGRQNIDDFNMQLSTYPAKWLVGLVQFHHFSLVSARDALYNKSGAVMRSSPAGTAGKFVGNEIDVVGNVHLTQHQDFLVGYSRFYSGEFIRNTGNPFPSDFFYFQYSIKW